MCVSFIVYKIVRCNQGRINHSGGPIPSLRRGPFSLMRTHRFSLSECTFLLPKVDDLFSRQRTSTQRGKNWQLIGGPLVAGGPPMVQPVQWIIRPWMQPVTYCNLNFAACDITVSRFQQLTGCVEDERFTVGSSRSDYKNVAWNIAHFSGD